MVNTREVDSTSHLYLIDGSGFIFRAYHALPPLMRSDGTPMGAVQGFCNMIWKLIQDLQGEDQPTHLAVIFDHSSKTFRNEIYPKYKANRPPPPEDLIPQFSLIREATRAFELPAIDKAGFEADDIIATYATLASHQGARVTIASSDKDLMQLVNKQISLLDPMKSRRIEAAEVYEKFGVAPDRVIDVQALAGDSVDNVPGVPGIGIKTAAQLIETYGDLETLLQRADEIKQVKRREKLMAHAEDAKISKELVTLKKDCLGLEAIDKFGTQALNHDKLLAFTKKMEFRTLSRRIEGHSNGLVQMSNTPTPPKTIDRSNYETVTSLPQLHGWIERVKHARCLAVDVETDALSSSAANLVGISLATAPGQACYIPTGHYNNDLTNFAQYPKQLKESDVLEQLKPVLENPAILKIGQNFKYDLSVFRRYGINPAPIDDTMLLSYVEASSIHGHGMDELAKLHLEHECIKFKDVCGSGKKQISFAQVDLDRATPYAAEDADVTLRLWHILKPAVIKSGLLTVYETLERGMVDALSTMELHGVKVDVAQLSRLSTHFSQKIEIAEKLAHTEAGEPFNLGSPKQIGDILFGRLGLAGGKKTKTGAWSTDAGVLEELARGGNTLAEAILTWRQYSKLKSTYSDALKQAINAKTNRVHTNFSLAATSTGRLSSSEPNLQNIPIRTEEGRKIREAFIAEPGNVIVAADYSQIELRLLAHIANVDALKQAFHDGLDIHALTASEMFGVPLEAMDPMTRRNAKAINFGIIYGISPFGLANNLGITRNEAKIYIDNYFEKFPGIAEYMENMKILVREKSAVSTIFGRRIHLTGIQNKNPAVRQFAERQAINAPIQGAAADIMRRAMMKMNSALPNSGLHARMILQVHDELVFEVKESDADDLIMLAKNVMVGAALPAVNLDVPFDVDARAAKTWGQAH